MVTTNGVAPAQAADAFADFGPFKVKRASDFQDAGVCMFLYSRGGAGKTTLAAALADSIPDAPIVIFDAEGGAKVVNDRKDIPVIVMESWKHLDRMEEEIKKTAILPWKTIILDNESEYMQLCINEVTSSDEDQITQPEWGSIQRKMRAHIRFYRDLAKSRNINVIFICWDVTDKDETNRMVQKLNFIPSLQKEIPGLVDIIGYIEGIDNDPEHRTITFAFSRKTDAKFRRNRSEAARSIPANITYGLDNLPLPDFINALRRGVKFPVEKYQVSRTTAASAQRSSTSASS